MSSPQVYVPYLALIVFLLAALIAVGREFWITYGLNKAYPLARICLAVPLAVFGAEHFASPQALMQLVPPWMPAKLFWTYFVGVALLAAALSIISRIAIRSSATLLGIMFFCFVVMMDVPGAIAAPHNRLGWTLAARELAFSAGGVLLATSSKSRVRTIALYVVALITIFYGIENVLHPDFVPVVPLAKKTPLWIPLAHLWTPLTGILLIAGGLAMCVRNIARQAAAAIGAWIVLLVLTFYLAIMLSQKDLEGLNYFADTLLFGGVLLAAVGVYDAKPHSVP